MPKIKQASVSTFSPKHCAIREYNKTTPISVDVVSQFTVPDQS